MLVHIAAVIYEALKLIESPEITALEAALDLEETRLRTEADAAFERASRKPTGENRKAHKAAEAALKTFLKERHEPETESTYKGLPEVLAFLEGEGWKIGKTKIYDDFNEGRIKAEKDGSFRLSSLLDYARVNLQKKDGTKGADAVSLQEQKQQEEMLRIRIDRQQRELKYKQTKGELIPISEVEIELSKRAVFLVTDRKNVWRSNAVEIIRLVSGDPQKAPELIAFGLRLEDEIIGRYSRPMNFNEEE